MDDCETCEGDGLIITGWDDGAYENIEAVCPDCEGTGKKPKETNSMLGFGCIVFDDDPHQYYHFTSVKNRWTSHCGKDGLKEKSRQMIVSEEAFEKQGCPDCKRISKERGGK